MYYFFSLRDYQISTHLIPVLSQDEVEVFVLKDPTITGDYLQTGSHDTTSVRGYNNCYRINVDLGYNR